MRSTRAFPVALLIVLGVSAGTLPASAFTFDLISDGSGQILTWYWERNIPFQACWNTIGQVCGNVSSSNGQIPLTGGGLGSFPPQYIRAGGMLRWTGSSGSLEVVAKPEVYGTVNIYQSGQAVDGWAAVDARAVPLTFVVVAEPDDPFPLLADLQIHPWILGLIDATNFLDGHIRIQYQFEMSVAINGTVVTSDSLYRDYQIADVGNLYWYLAFPKDGANDFVVHGVPEGSEVTVMIWAYFRNTMDTHATVATSSRDDWHDFGRGTAVVVDVRSLDAVAVDEAKTPGPFAVAAHPNPAAGAARLSYSLGASGPARMSVYDVTGHRVATLVDGVVEPGRHEIQWDGKSVDGRRLASGVYLVELVSGRERAIERIVWLGR